MRLVDIAKPYNISKRYKKTSTYLPVRLHSYCRKISQDLDTVARKIQWYPKISINVPAEGLTRIGFCLCDDQMCAVYTEQTLKVLYIAPRCTHIIQQKQNNNNHRWLTHDNKNAWYIVNDKFRINRVNTVMIRKSIVYLALRK